MVKGQSASRCCLGIIITFSKSQGYLAEHECSAIWGDYNSTEIETNQIKCWFLRRGENWSRVSKQQTQPTYGMESGNRSRAALVEGECSHHCASPVPPNKLFDSESLQAKLSSRVQDHRVKQQLKVLRKNLTKNIQA